MNIKRRWSYILIAIMLFSVAALGVTYAGPQDELNDVNSQLKDVQTEIQEKENKESELLNQMKNLETQINDVEAEIANMQGDIEETKQLVAAAKQALDEAQRQVDEQNEEMNLRLRAMYMNGNVGVLEILLGSEGINDFLNNMDMVQRIMDNDVEVLKTLEEQYNLLEERRQQLETLQSQLEEKQQAEKAKQQALKADKNQVGALKEEVSMSLDELEAMENDLIAAANALTSQIYSAQSTDTEFVGGAFIAPVSSVRVTSEYGNRMHPILGYNKLHTGIDFSASTGTPVMASAAGTVIIATYNSSYGNYVVIDHGGGITTLYAHNSSLAVSVGASVTQGQVIAYAGSTGMSTGPHCHFEVRVDGQYQNPRNYLSL